MSTSHQIHSANHDTVNMTQAERIAARETCQICRVIFRADGEFRIVDAMPQNAEFAKSSFERRTHTSYSTRPASEKQVAFLDKLLAEKDHTFTADFISEVKADVKKASSTIDQLLAMPRKRAKAAGGAVTEDGMYRTPDGTVYKVQIAKQGSGNLYAKRLVIEDGHGSFEYAPGAVRQLQADWKMTLEQAKEFGQLYGICCKCGADLTDEGSIAAGIGPICGSKGW